MFVLLMAWPGVPREDVSILYRDSPDATCAHTLTTRTAAAHKRLLDILLVQLRQARNLIEPPLLATAAVVIGPADSKRSKTSASLRN